MGFQVGSERGKSRGEGGRNLSVLEIQGNWTDIAHYLSKKIGKEEEGKKNRGNVG